MTIVKQLLDTRYPGQHAMREQAAEEIRRLCIALLEIEQISDYCVNAEHYTAERGLTDLQEIRSVIKRTASRNSCGERMTTTVTNGERSNGQ